MTKKEIKKRIKDAINQWGHDNPPPSFNFFDPVSPILWAIKREKEKKRLKNLFKSRYG